MKIDASTYKILLPIFVIALSSPTVKALSVKIEHIEINQSIQYADNSVPLVAGKEGVVRVYLKALDGTVKDLRGTLNIHWKNESLSKKSSNFIKIQPINTKVEWQNLTSKVTNWQRKQENDINSTLNFIITAKEFPSHDATFNISSLTDSTNTVKCTNCDEKIAGPIKIYNLAPVTLRLFGFQYFGIPPRTKDVDAVISWIKRAYPLSDIKTEYSTRRLELLDNGGFNSLGEWRENITDKSEVLDCNKINVVLTKFASKFKPLDEASGRKVLYYGLVPDKLYPMRGCASTSKNILVASGPSGPTDKEMEKLNQIKEWTRQGTFSDIYAGHELAHLFGRKHVGSCKSPSLLDDEYPDKDGTISDPRSGKEVLGIDVGDTAIGFSSKAYLGKDSHDLLSYCGNIWISPYTYYAILSQLIQPNITTTTYHTDIQRNLSPGINFGISSAFADELPAVKKVRIIGSINMTTRAGTLEVSPAGDVVTDQLPDVSKAIIRLCQDVNCANSNKNVNLFAVPWYPSSNSTTEKPQGLIMAVLNIPSNVTKAELLFDGELIAETSIGQSLPEKLSIYDRNGPPVSGAPTIEFEWEPVGGSNGNVLYDVDISRKNGPWEPVTIGTKRTSVRIGSDLIKGADSIRLRVRATNGLDITEEVSKEIPIKK